MKTAVNICVLALCAIGLSCQAPPPRDGSGRLPGERDTEEYPLAYSVGSFDDRFGITREEFLAAAAEAEGIWEKTAGRQLFRPDRETPFRLNLVYDERQERTNEARKVKAAIDSRGVSYDALVWQHARRLERMKESEARYDTAAKGLQARLDAHNAVVTSWNERGGAPAEEYQRLERELAALREEGEYLKRLLADFNDDVAAVNDLVAQINEVAAKNNIDVEYFNGAFVESREFEQGVYDGTGITIYQFSDIPELRLALVHEFGHALGFGHVDDPAAIMYYKMGKQDAAKPALAPADIGMLKEKFRED